MLVIDSMKNRLIALIMIGIFAGIGIGSYNSNANKPENKQSVLSAQSTEKKENITNKQSEPGIPLKVQIPAINVDTNIEAVGNDAEGRMDVPKDADETAWYEPGFRPGQQGNSVLAGHYDKKDGSPAVFWNLNKLKEGDKIIVTDDKEGKITFSVTKIAKYPYDNFPLTKVFGTSEKPMLNLITCQGIWNKKSNTYAERLVVYAQRKK